MGTDVSIEIIADPRGLNAEKAEESIAEIKEIFSKNEKIFSRFQEDSELSLINDNLGKEMKISREMTEVLDLCLKFNKISNGYFDPRIIGNLEKIGYDKDFTLVADLRGSDADLRGKNIVSEKIESELADDLIINKENKTVIVKKRIDTTGIAKGWTVDEAAKYLDGLGYKNYIVDAGGDMNIKGLNNEGEKWRVGIEGMEDNKLMLALTDCGVATSGISRKRWKIGEKKVHHLINPKDPENFSHDIKTVTVVADKTVEADGRAKVLVLMGREKGLEFANQNNIKALFLDYKGSVYLSETIKENIINNLK